MKGLASVKLKEEFPRGGLRVAVSPRPCARTSWLMASVGVSGVRESILEIIDWPDSAARRD